MCAMSAEKGFDHGGGAVADSNPHHFRWVAKEKASLMKIGVFCHDDETVLGRILPDGVVTSRAQPNVAHMRGVRIIMLEGRDQSIGEVVIEEQFHLGGRDTSFRSRSAANARHARISSRVRSGKSLRMSPSLMPDARYSRTS